ncbi:hypothetical protein ACYCSU_16735 [Paenibacillus sp. ALE1]
MRLWNNSKFSPGCATIVMAAPLCFLGFLAFPDAGLFAPLILGSVIACSIFLTQKFWRYYYGIEKGDNLLWDNKKVHVGSTYVCYEGDQVGFEEITGYELVPLNKWVYVNYKRNNRKSRITFMFNANNDESFFKDLDVKYKKYIESNLK